MPSHAASATMSSGDPGQERAAERRDRAERAPPVAARRELEVGDRARREPGARDPGVPGHVDVGGGAFDRRDRQQRAPVDGGVRGGRVAAEDVGEPLGELGVVVEAEHGVGLGEAVGQLLAVALGQAPDGDDLGARDVGGRQQGVDRVLLGLFDEAAGVDDDHIGMFVGVDKLPPRAGEPPGQLLGVDLVAGAAQRQQRGTPQRDSGAAIDTAWFRHARQGNRPPVIYSEPWLRCACGGPGPPT